jgi:glutamyl-tRNA reductase
LEPTLLVIGLNHRTAAPAQGERFWIGEDQRYQVLKQLRSAEGIEEVIVLSTDCRTEFLLWASDPTLAANSLVNFLSANHGLRLSDWEHFYRLLDDAALLHIFRVAAGLDSIAACAPRIASQLESAWIQARSVDATGSFLNSVIEKALAVSRQLHDNTPAGQIAPGAEKILAAEAHTLRSKLKAETVVPTIVALRHRLDELCRQELDSFIEERGPFTREQDQSLHAITAQVVQKIASSLVRELKELPEKGEQERMTAAVTRLFHLDAPSPAHAGTRSERRA